MMNIHWLIVVGFPLLPYTLCFEPITVTSTAALLVGVGVIYGKNKLSCLMGYEECCQQPWIANVTAAQTVLKKQIEDKLFGQHIASNIVLEAVIAHRKKEEPKKALVLSFHGCNGCGKNYVASIVAKALYQEGLDSKFVHLYIGSLHFPRNGDEVSQKEKLKAEIKKHVKNCPEQLFIFDEMDEMNPKLIDVVENFVNFHEKVGDVDYRKSIFVFLSNSGSDEIAKVTYSFWEDGRNRDEITYKDLEDVIRSQAKATPGGLHNSALIDHHLIDFFIPFLPMDKSSIIKCTEQEFKEAGVPDPSLESIEKVLQSLIFKPEESQLFSDSGCKTIKNKVLMFLAGNL